MRTLVAVLALLLSPSQPAPQFVPAPGPPLEVGPGSGTILLEDVNRDGRIDMLTRHLLTKLVTVQIGDGRGSFRPAAKSPITFSYTPGEMALGDFNRDGISDLAVTPGDHDVIDVLLGTGSGDFARSAGSPFTVTTRVEPYNKRILRLADINEDGNLDAVTANGRRQNSFAIMFGDGRGGFSRGPIVDLDAGRDGYSFAFGDVDGDGHLDAVNASRGSYDDKGPGRVIILKGDGKGGFRRSSGPPLPVPSGPRYVTMGDLNGDERIDVAIAHPTGLSVLLNDGRGGFPRATPVALGGDTHFFHIVDVNRDRRADLVAPTVDSVTVLLGDGRSFPPAPGSPFRAGPGAYHVAIADLNADGRKDLVAASFEGKTVTLLLGR